MQHEFPAPLPTSSINDLLPPLRFPGYPFERMELGDFFEVPLDIIPDAKSRYSSQAQNSLLAFATKRLPDKSYRIMRIT
jgi:hypothetical protein